MRIVNHDGGADVLRKFSAAGALCQLNLTLCRLKSLATVLEENATICSAVKSETLAQFSERVKYFFPPTYVNSDAHVSENERVTAPAVAPCYYPLPRGLKQVAVLSDEAGEVAVVTFDSREGNKYKFL